MAFLNTMVKSCGLPLSLNRLCLASGLLVKKELVIASTALIPCVLLGTGRMEGMKHTSGLSLNSLYFNFEKCYV